MKAMTAPCSRAQAHAAVRSAVAMGARMAPFRGLRNADPVPGGHDEGASAHARGGRPFRRLAHGPDRASAERRPTADVARGARAPGPGRRARPRARPAAIRASHQRDGGIIDDLMVAHRGDHLVLIVNAAQKEVERRTCVPRLSQDCTIELLDDRALAGPARAGERSRSARARAGGCRHALHGRARARDRRQRPASSPVGLYRRGRLRDQRRRRGSRGGSRASFWTIRPLRWSGSAPATACGSRPACASTARTSTSRRRRSKRRWNGRSESRAGPAARARAGFPARTRYRAAR